MVGGVISLIHDQPTNEFNPRGLFNYHWVDDHINDTADVGTNCQDTEQSLRFVMLTVLGPAAINEDNSSSWSTRQKALGLVLDLLTETVSMPPSKVIETKAIVRAALIRHRCGDLTIGCCSAVCAM